MEGSLLGNGDGSLLLNTVLVRSQVQGAWPSAGFTYNRPMPIPMVSLSCPRQVVNGSKAKSCAVKLKWKTLLVQIDLEHISRPVNWSPSLDLSGVRGWRVIAESLALSLEAGVYLQG